MRCQLASFLPKCPQPPGLTRPPLPRNLRLVALCSPSPTTLEARLLCLGPPTKGMLAGGLCFPQKWTIHAVACLNWFAMLFAEGLLVSPLSDGFTSSFSAANQSAKLLPA